MSEPPAELSAPDSAALAEVLGELTDPTLSRPERRRRLLRLSKLLAERARGAGAGAVMSGRWVAGVLLEAAPHIPFRDANLLSEHYRGLTGEALADAMVRNAANVTMGVGAAVGTFATAQWIVAPVLLAVPLEVLVETLVVAVVEIKLLAELHAVHGVAVPGTPAQRALTFVGVWVRRRGVNPLQPWTISAAVAAAGRASLSHRMLGRFARNLGTLVPLMVGAVYGARSNRKQTRELADAVRTDLRAARHLELPAPQPR